MQFIRLPNAVNIAERVFPELVEDWVDIYSMHSIDICVLLEFHVIMLVSWAIEWSTCGMPHQCTFSIHPHRTWAILELGSPLLLYLIPGPGTYQQITLTPESICTTSATTLVSVRNTQVFRTALTALTEPHTLWRRISRYPSRRRRVALHSISKMYFSHWSERMSSVNLDASISGVSDPRREFLPAFRVSGSADDKPESTWERPQPSWERQRRVWEHLESQSCIQFVFSSMYLCIYESI